TNERLPQVPGAASFKRMLDGALFTDARARRAPHGGLGQLALGGCFWAATVPEDVRGGARRVARPWSGGARRAGARPCVSARGAPRITIPKELTEECLRGGSAPPNGSRLSCGRLARRRKRSGRTSRARQGTTQRLPLKRERPPASSACQAARPDADVSGEGGGGQGQPRSPPGHRDPPRFHLEGPCL